MQRQKRPFYIIGHNPNSIEEAKEFLNEGVNGLEPDIVHAEGRFYISHTPLPSYKNIPTVEEYLIELKNLLLQKGYPLALIIFDMKSTDFDPTHFMALVKENFNGAACDGVTMLMTHSDDTDFITQYKGDFSNVGVGVDESNTPPNKLQNIFKKSGQKNFTYADGITTFLTKPGVFSNVTEAQRCRNQNEPNSFKLIYTWVLSNEDSMRKYLDTYIDGIMVDPPAIKRLKKLVTLEPYNEVYELAPYGYNPFSAPPLPKYILAVKTKDQYLAGTDAQVLFTLTGSSGISLKSLPYNGNLDGRLERGSTDHITLEGIDLGEIHSLTVEMLTSGIDAGWLPENIILESRLLPTPLNFVFNKDDEPQEWMAKKTGAITKFPSP
jgi:hypothetical protein